MSTQPIRDNPCEDPTSGKVDLEANTLKQEIGTPAFEFVQLQVRKVVAFEMIADALQTMARVQSDRYAKEYPPQRVPRPAEIRRASDDKSQHYDDRTTDEWLKATEAALPQKSRFQARLDAAKAAGAAEVPKE